jgi:hypothetical protein
MQSKTTKYTSQTLLQQISSIPKQNKHNHSGIYQLTCLDCGNIYTGQMERKS